MSEPSRNDEERDFSREENKEVAVGESKDGVRDDPDNESSDGSYQDGVKAIEAISKAWDMKSLIVAYCRYEPW
jgi:hypothetical protein